MPFALHGLYKGKDLTVHFLSVHFVKCTMQVQFSSFHSLCMDLNFLSITHRISSLVETGTDKLHKFTGGGLCAYPTPFLGTQYCEICQKNCSFRTSCGTISANSVWTRDLFVVICTSNTF